MLMKLINDKMLFSPEAEAAVLGSMILDPSCIGEILPMLGVVDSFHLPENQTIYNSLAALFLGNNPTDAIALRTDLKSINQLEKVGGVEYIGKIVNSVPSSANAVYYAGVVKDRQKYRGLVDASDKIQKVLSEPMGVNDQIQKIQDLALNIEGSTTDKEYFSMSECIGLVKDDPNHQPAIPTGLYNIDKIIGGFEAGDLVIVAGRPSMGKSGLALQIALNMAKTGESIIFFTLEMTAKALTQRALMQMEDKELEKLDICIHTHAQTPTQQIAFLKTRKQTHMVDVAFVDYLQLMSAGGKAENRNQEVTTISRNLKLAAVNEDITICALSQLNRQVESRTDHKPRLSDLRESGSIEQDADIVMLLHRDDYYRKHEDPKSIPDGTTELIIAKNRRGPTGIAELIFLDEQVKFVDRARYEHSF